MPRGLEASPWVNIVQEMGMTRWDGAADEDELEEVSAEEEVEVFITEAKCEGESS